MSFDNDHDELPLPVEIIFSCQVCQATISDIHQESAHGGDIDNGTPSTRDRPLPRLWLTECAHLTCGIHLDGGGIAFHPEGEYPKAVCPICSIEKEDHRLKRLHGIHGTSRGDYDAGIPKCWFQTPPVKLDGEGDAMDALRFHYISLVRFGVNILAKYRQARERASQDEALRNDALERCRGMENRLDAAELRVRDLEQCERELKPWKERESKIRHYLGVFTEVTQENEKLREQLTAMGYAVPRKKYSFEPSTEANDTTAPEQPSDSLKPPHKSPKLHRSGSRFQLHSSSSRTLSGRVADPSAVDVDQYGLKKAPPLAVGISSNYSGGVDPRVPPSQQAQGRNLMPPPPVPHGKPLLAEATALEQSTLNKGPREFAVSEDLPDPPRFRSPERTPIQLDASKSGSTRQTIQNRSGGILHRLRRSSAARPAALAAEPLPPFRSDQGYPPPASKRSAYEYIDHGGDEGAPRFATSEYSVHAPKRRKHVRNDNENTAQRGFTEPEVHVYPESNLYDPRSSQTPLFKPLRYIDPRLHHTGIQPSFQAESVTSPFFRKPPAATIVRELRTPFGSAQRNQLRPETYGKPEPIRYDHQNPLYAPQIAMSQPRTQPDMWQNRGAGPQSPYMQAGHQPGGFSYRPNPFTSAGLVPSTPNTSWPMHTQQVRVGTKSGISRPSRELARETAAYPTATPQRAAYMMPTSQRQPQYEGDGFTWGHPLHGGSRRSVRR